MIDKLKPPKFNDPPWIPMRDPVDIKHIGKLAEEANELARICARIIIQGIDGIDPATGECNKLALEKELADVRANGLLCVRRFGLDNSAIAMRTDAKMGPLKAWHEHADGSLPR